jgi:hypothetical protein
MSNPLLLADPHKDAIPESYVIQVTTSQCTACGHIGQSCETYARTWLKGQWGKPFSNFRPMEKPKYRLPIERIMRPVVRVPFCDHCLDPNKIVEALDYPPVQTPKTKTIIGMIQTPPAPPKPVAAKTKGPKTSSTDDLLDGLDLD